jgi:alkanesulfonate monooxygenase
MTATPPLRYGIWALVRSTFGAPGHPAESPRASWPRLRDQVLEAERLGFDATLVAHHTRSGQSRGDNLDAWTVSAALAAITERIEIITAIKPYIYHPVFLAKMALQIEEISQGRCAINFVNAHDKDEIENAGLTFPEHDERYAVGREWLALVRQLWLEGVSDHEGKYYRVEDYELSPRGQFRDRPRIYMGGESQAAREVVRDLADVWFLNAVDENVAAGLIEDMGRQPRSGPPVRYGLPAFVIAKATQDQAEEEFAYLLELANSPDRQNDPALVPSGQPAHRRASLGSRGGTNAGLIGSFDAVAEKIVRFNQTGIEMFMLSFQPFEEQMRIFANEVMPRVDRLRASA